MCLGFKNFSVLIYNYTNINHKLKLKTLSNIFWLWIDTVLTSNFLSRFKNILENHWTISLQVFSLNYIKHKKIAFLYKKKLVSHYCVTQQNFEIVHSGNHKCQNPANAKKLTHFLFSIYYYRSPNQTIPSQIQCDVLCCADRERLHKWEKYRFLLSQSSQSKSWN